jgi:hypothetical protein
MTGSLHHDAFDDRRLGLEEEYFRTRDAQLVGKLKKVFHTAIGSAEIAKATGIADPALLERFVAANLRGEMLVLFKLYPLVEIAWADGHVDTAERIAVIDSAIKSGVPRSGEIITRLEEWLSKGPTDELRKVWAMYAGQLVATLSPAELNTFRSDLVAYAKRVAEASGGILGMVWQISPSEQSIIDRLTKLLTHA